MFVIYILRLIEILLWLDFLCSWWILKSFFPVDSDLTKSNFYFEKFWKDFGDYKHIKTRAMCNSCPKAEQCLLYTSDSHTFIGKDGKDIDEKDLFV